MSFGPSLTRCIISFHVLDAARWQVVIIMLDNSLHKISRLDQSWRRCYTPSSWKFSVHCSEALYLDALQNKTDWKQHWNMVCCALRCSTMQCNWWDTTVLHLSRLCTEQPSVQEAVLVGAVEGKEQPMESDSERLVKDSVCCTWSFPLLRCIAPSLLQVGRAQINRVRRWGTDMGEIIDQNVTNALRSFSNRAF